MTQKIPHSELTLLRTGYFTLRAVSPVGQKQGLGLSTTAFTFILGFEMGAGILLPQVQPEYSNVSTFHKDSLVDDGVLDHALPLANF